MFSGIVEMTSVVSGVQPGYSFHTIQIQRPSIFDDVKTGDSIAVNGVCLTITDLTNSILKFDVVLETLQRTNLSTLFVGQKVNLERSLQLSQRIGGHYVQGHVDTTSHIKKIEASDETKLITFSMPCGYEKYLVEKGYITIDGMSLTLVAIDIDSFKVAFIPHTLQNTIAMNYTESTVVNIETDIIGKYVIRHLELGEN